MKKFLHITAALGILTPGIILAQSTSQDYAVEVSATVTNNPAAIHLSWPNDPNAASWTVYRKAKTDFKWGAPLATLPSDTTYTDNNVTDGKAYEYEIVKQVTGGAYTGYGYIYAGMDVPAVDYRGRTLLIFPSKLMDTLASQIQRLKLDMVGDGWQVTEIPLPDTATVPGVREAIRKAYAADPVNTKSVFLLGHVPVLFSGSTAIDGHVPNHEGAWPADMIYGDVNGTYTDMWIDDENGDYAQNHNIPGDGKYDQDILASLMELQVGRVDMFDLPAFKLSEMGLLKQYLDKDHAWRMGAIKTQDRGLVQDNFGTMSGEAFAATGYKSFSAMFGSQNVYTLPYESTLSKAPYMWSYGTGGGTPTTAGGIITTDQMASDSLQTVFTMLFGSWFGDWSFENDLLRAALANKGPVLIDAWSGRPQWYFHHMALGETAGYDAWVSQNNYTSYFKSTFLDTGARVVSAALMGDPNLRMHIVEPVTNLKLTNLANAQAKIDWQAPQDKDIIGYNVYRASSVDSVFTRLNSTPLTTTTFTDSKPLNGSNIYMVRVVKLQQSASGTYYNMSTGQISNIRINTAIARAYAPEMKLYPNPTTGRLNLEIPENVNGEMRIMDASGRIVKMEKLNASAGTIQTLDVSSCTKGIYTIEIIAPEGVLHAGFVMQ